MLFLQAY